ncbi:histidine kinase A domain protein [Verrucomicrobiia bacterium DG1235]|nr:histidine kinase A domain protein [Verrucomicrobiae bacterium DG1235]
MTRLSLQSRMTLWFAFSTLGVTLVFAIVSYFHLRHELSVEKWERSHPDRPDFTLHGSYTDDEVSDIAGELIRSALLYSSLVALFAFLLGRYLAKKSLKPVTDINQQLQAIEAANLDKRVHLPEADAPLKDIAININALLDRIESSYDEVSNFSSRVAHELKTPLTLMRLQLEDSAKQIEPEMAESLQDELHRMEHYVEQCLLIARAEQGQLQLDFETVSINQLIQDQIEPYELLAREENRQLVLRSDTTIQATTSRWAFRQILHNLFGNALQHGTGDILIELRTQGAKAVAIRNQVKASNTKGTAIGLRIVDALVRQLPEHTITHTQEKGIHEAVVTIP